MKFLGFFLMCLLVNQINGMAYRRCGTQLSEIMWMICENGFNTMPTKRAGKVLNCFRLKKLSSSY